MKKIIILMRVVVIFYLIIGIIKWNTTTVVAALLSLVLMTITSYLKKKLNLDKKLELLIYIFIITTEVLGQIYHFYTRVPIFDIIIHTYSSFVISYIALIIIKKHKLPKIITILFIFSFAMMCESIWEIFEFSTDHLLKTDMQKDTIINEITSYYLSEDKDTPTTMVVDNVVVNNISFTDKYNGYLDIGLYDTISDMSCALVGALIFIIIIKRRL